MSKPANVSTREGWQFAARSLPLLTLPGERIPSAKNNAPSAPASSGDATGGVTLGTAFLRLFRHTHQYLIQKWNWKSAILSTILRSVLFFLTNLTAGLPAAFAAFATEWIYRGITAGFYGAVTQVFCDVEPVWAGAVTVLVLLPIANHSVEFFVHWLRGTHRLFTSIGASVALTAVSSLFNLYAMRKGALVVGRGRKALSHDLARIPGLIVEFCLLPVRWIRHRRGKPEDCVPPSND